MSLMHMAAALPCSGAGTPTQVIIEKANRGERDHIQAALSLFVDFVAILVRLLVILLQNAEKREAEERNKRKRRA